MFGLNLVHQAMEKVKVIRYRLKAAQSHQKSYVNVRQIDLEFEVGDKVFLKVSPIKRVMQFGKKGKLSPRYMGPYMILRRVGDIAYELEFPSSLSYIYPVFHVSTLRKCIGDPLQIMPIKDIGILD